MTFLTDLQRTQMLANGAARARGEAIDPYPVVKLHTLDAGAVWLLVSLDADGDQACASRRIPVSRRVNRCRPTRLLRSGMDRSTTDLCSKRFLASISRSM